LTNLASQLTTVIVNYKTRKLTQACYESFRKFYPSIPIILIDNHSQDDSAAYVKSLDEHDEFISVVFHSTNIGHGPAMHQAIVDIATPFTLTLDSDCEILEGGILELMMQEFADNGKLYACGWRRWVDRKTGVPHEWNTSSPPKSPRFIPYIHPYAAIYRLSMYAQLRPFADHGAPCLFNMVDAHDKGFALKPYKKELDKHIKHWKAGTRRMFSGAWHPKDSTRPKAWIADRNYPI